MIAFILRQLIAMVEFNPEKHVRTPDKPCVKCKGEIRMIKFYPPHNFGKCAYCASERAKKYIKENVSPEQRREQSRKSYYKNRKKCLKKMKEWRNNNPEKVKKNNFNQKYKINIEKNGIVFSESLGNERMSAEEFKKIFIDSNMTVLEFSKSALIDRSDIYRILKGKTEVGLKTTFAVRQWQAAQNKTDEPDWS